MEADFDTVPQMISRAEAAMPDGVRDHVAGAAGTEATLRRNRLALDGWAFRPRVLRDVSVIDTRTTLLGCDLSLPVLLAPIGSLHTIREDGAVAAARGAARFGVPAMVSSVVDPGYETIAAAAGAGSLMFQLYVRGDALDIADVIGRVKAAGYRAIAVTVDSAYYGIRDRQRLHKWQPPASKRGGREHQARVTWETVGEIRRLAAPLPVILKGIQTGEDATLAVEAGVDAIYVSNHGGRQLDHCLGTADVLPEVAAAVAGRVPVIVDGGFMRGTDVVKAMALGASAVGLGRFYAFALAAGGEAGVVRALEILDGEIRNVMGLLGVRTLGELGRNHVAAAPLPDRP